MGAEQEVKVLWGPDGGNPNRRDKGAGEGREERWGSREGASSGSLRWSTKPSESKASCRLLGTAGELASSSRPVSVGAASGNDVGVGTKLCVLTRGGLSASACGR